MKDLYDALGIKRITFLERLLLLTVNAEVSYSFTPDGHLDTIVSKHLEYRFSRSFIIKWYRKGQLT